jgi:nitrogen-specific signal transduction histidine kinase
MGKTFSEEIYDINSGSTVLITCNPYHNADGELMGTVLIAKDITEKKEVENEISYLKDFNENIVENLGDGLEIIGEDHKIQFMNASFFESVGKDVIGKKCYEMHFERNEPCEGCPIIDGIENMNINTMECVSPEGKTYLITHSPLKNQDGSYSAILLFKDITESKNMESELIKVEKMAGIGSLISGIAHEVNNPIAGIIGYAEATMEEEDLNKIRDYSISIIDSATRVSDLFTWLVRYSQSPTDGEMKNFNLNDIIELSLNVMKRTSNFQNVEVVTDFKNIPTICGNPDEIQQVFINLLFNSLKTLSGSGKIHIETKKVNGTIQAIFRDSGAAIPKGEADMAHNQVFSGEKGEAEHDQENWRKTLGMFVNSMILKKHKAGVNVKTESDSGTTFTISFPANGHGYQNA